MAKDPAINWYWDNWSGGVKGFSRHQKGCYMDLLESQFYLGHLSLEKIKNILASDFNQWVSLKEKFIQDEQGNFFNERLELEKNKRRMYSESRSKNRSKKDMLNISKRYDKHIKNIPGIEIGNEIELKLKCLDEIYLEQERMKWPHIDFDFEVNTFKNKVRGSPEHYAGHETSGIRLAFQSQLRNAKPKMNGKGKQTKLDEDRNRANGVAEYFARKNQQ